MMGTIRLYFNLLMNISDEEELMRHYNVDVDDVISTKTYA